MIFIYSRDLKKRAIISNVISFQTRSKANEAGTFTMQVGIEQNGELLECRNFIRDTETGFDGSIEQVKIRGDVVTLSGYSVDWLIDQQLVKQQKGVNVVFRNKVLNIKENLVGTEEITVDCQIGGSQVEHGGVRDYYTDVNADVGWLGYVKIDRNNPTPVYVRMDLALANAEELAVEGVGSSVGSTQMFMRLGMKKEYYQTTTPNWLFYFRSDLLNLPHTYGVLKGDGWHTYSTILYLNEGIRGMESSIGEDGGTVTFLNDEYPTGISEGSGKAYLPCKLSVALFSVWHDEAVPMMYLPNKKNLPKLKVKNLMFVPVDNIYNQFKEYGYDFVVGDYINNHNGNHRGVLGYMDSLDYWEGMATIAPPRPYLNRSNEFTTRIYDRSTHPLTWWLEEIIKPNIQNSDIKWGGIQGAISPIPDATLRTEMWESIGAWLRKTVEEYGNYRVAGRLDIEDTTGNPVEVYVTEGRDLTDTEKPDAVVLSEERANLSDADGTFSTQSYANVCIVSGHMANGREAHLTLYAQEYEGNRREIIVEVSDQGSEESVDEEGNILDKNAYETDDEYFARMRAEGELALQAALPSVSFEFSIEDSTRFKLGDVVICVLNKLGLEFKSKVAVIDYSVDHKGTRRKATLGIDKYRRIKK